MSDRASWVYTAIGALANTSQLFEYEQEKQVLAICKEAMAQYDKERAVIEAARALFRGYTVEDSSADAWRCDDVLDHRLHDLFLKVEALDKAEEE